MWNENLRSTWFFNCAALYTLYMKKRVSHIVTCIYPDAAYSYHKQQSIPSGKIVSSGVITNETGRYINLKVAWSKDRTKTLFGVVIPKPSKRIVCNNVRTGDLIIVYWKDVFVYTDDYKGPFLPTPILTKGVLLKNTSGYIVLKEPQTLNMYDMCNHPEKRPLLYYIPKSAVTRIHSIKNENL